MGIGGRRLQELKKKLKEMYDRSFRTLPGVYAVEYTDGEDGDFFITFRMRPPKRQPIVYRRHFDKHYVFGESCRTPDQSNWNYRMRVCRFGQETVEAVLEHMRVL